MHSRLNTYRMALLALLGAASLAGPARADTRSYASDRRQIRACVLVFNQATYVNNGLNIPENAVPYVWYVMDQRTDMKPAGWEFVNPLAPTVITGDIFNRWSNRGNDPNIGGAIFTQGLKVTKGMGAYWEENLDNLSGQDLENYDVVLMAYHQPLNFTPDEQAKLRHFVDAGGTIWFENLGDGVNRGMDIPAGNGQFILPVQFETEASNNGPPTAASTHHPLLNYPYGLTTLEIMGLGGGDSNKIFVATNPQAAPPPPGPGRLAADILLNPDIIEPVVNQGAGSIPLVEAGDFGAGHLVISSIGITTGINDFAGGYNVTYGANSNLGGNTSAVSGTNFLAARLVDLKFAYNLVAWTTSVPTGGVNVRHTTSSTENIGADLGEAWAWLTSFDGGGDASSLNPPSVGSGAVLNKDIIYYVDGFNVLHAFNTTPGLSLSGSRNPDNGIQDFNAGSPYDEIWSANLTGVAGTGSKTRVSTPVVMSLGAIQGGSAVPFDLVAVTNSLGATIAYPAASIANGNLAPNPAPAWVFNGAMAPGSLNDPVAQSLLFPITADPTELAHYIPAPAPAYSEGVLFTIGFIQATNDSTGQASWRVFALDPTSGANIFGATPGYAPSDAVGQPSTSVGMATPTGPLVAGYVQDQITGAYDKVVYVPSGVPQGALNNQSGVGGALNGVWFSVRNEPLLPISGSTTSFMATGNRAKLPWYAPINGGTLVLMPVLHVVVRNADNSVASSQDITYNPAAPNNVIRFSINYEQGIGFAGQPGQRNTIVTLTNAPIPAQGQTLTVSADYTLDWPGIQVGSSGTPTTQELSAFGGVSAQAGRHFNLYQASQAGGIANSTPPVYLSGAPALSSSDLLIFGAGDYANVNSQGALSSANGAQGGDRIYAYRDQYFIGHDASGNIIAQSPIVAWMYSPNDAVNDVANGVQAPPRIIVPASTVLAPTAFGNASALATYDFEIIGSPAIQGGTVYQAGWAHRTDGGGDAIIIMALNAQPSTTIRLGIPLSQVSSIQLVQEDVISGTTASPRLLHLTQSLTSTAAPQFMTVDPAAGTITVTNFYTTDGSLNLALPIQAIVQTSAGAQTSAWLTNAAGYGVLDNMLWYMVIPIGAQNGALPADMQNLGYPCSGLSVVGNSLYFGTDQEQVVSVDISGITNGGGWQSPFETDGVTPRVHSQYLFYNNGKPIFNAHNMANNPLVAINPPLGTAGTIAVPSPVGLAGLNNELTTIADSHRILQVDWADEAQLTMDATKSVGVAGGTLNGSGQIVAQKISFDHPNVAHLADLNDILVADTGNNRVILTDVGGNVVYEIHNLQNGLNMLRSGDPVTLNAPTDVQNYSESGTAISITNRDTGVTYTYNGGAYYASHYLIADSGNFRLVEVEDAYDGSGSPIQLHGSDGSTVLLLDQVVFVTHSSAEQNERYRYRTIQQFFANESDGSGNTVLATYLASAVDNLIPSAVTPGSVAVGVVGPNPQPGGGTNSVGPGGALVLIHRYPQGNVSYNDGDLATVISAITMVDVNGNPVRQQQLSNPAWFKEFAATSPTGAPENHYLIADDNGCYEVAPVNGQAIVRWTISADDYFYLTGRRLKATSIEKLSKSDALLNQAGTFVRWCPRYLITNAYSGADNVAGQFGFGNMTQGQIHGEVAEVRSLDYYWGTLHPLYNPNATIYDGYQSHTLAPAGTLSSQRYVLNNGVPAINLYGAVTWMAPGEQIVSPGQNGPYTIKRQIGDPNHGTSTFVMEQPTYANRQD